ncbi:UNVERIFIED_CONTAM: CalpB [Trichonephila clavipes]
MLFLDIFSEKPGISNYITTINSGKTKLLCMSIVHVRPTTINCHYLFNRVAVMARIDLRACDCWLLAAVANLTLNDSLFYRVVPNDQSFVSDYAGAFHFRFWQYGRWVDIVVDDRLPTCGGYWYILLIFIYKKRMYTNLRELALFLCRLHGSYEALKGGTACEAMEDFTGGVTEVYELDKAPPNFYRILHKAFERWSLMSCSIEVRNHVFVATEYQFFKAVDFKFIRHSVY